jgi:hypothetical protein
MIESLVSAIVRPPRREYTDEELELASCGVIKDRDFRRQDFVISSSKGDNLEGSIWNPSKLSDCCILYLHPNSGNRMDAIRSRALAFCLVLGCSVCDTRLTFISYESPSIRPINNLLNLILSIFQLRLRFFGLREIRRRLHQLRRQRKGRYRWAITLAVLVN